MDDKITCGSCPLGNECRYAFVGLEDEIPRIVLIRCPFDEQFYHNTDSPCWFPDRWIRTGGKKGE